MPNLTRISHLLASHPDFSEYTHLMDCKHDSLRPLSLSDDQVAKLLFHRGRCDIRISVEAVPYDQ